MLNPAFATESYDYSLPEECIAQLPSEKRGDSRLLAVVGGVRRDLRIGDFPRLLEPDDLLVFNDTRVIPGRLWGSRAATGGKAEILILGCGDEKGVELLLRTRGRPRAGEIFLFAEGELRIELVENTGPGIWRAATIPAPPDHLSVIERHGSIPLPPYIHRSENDPRDVLDRERYQTVFARRPGAAAAPTAGLHLSEELLAEIEARGVRRAAVTLHVGPGTFRPVSRDDLRDHPMHEESWELSPATARAHAECRARGGRIVALGTTAVRVLESCARPDGSVQAGRGQTRLFIHPPYRFRAVDALFTNFHSPRSTLLMLVSALAGRECTLEAYEHALQSGYRFLSYGDATFWAPPFPTVESGNA